MKLAWANDKPFDFTGEFYRVKGAASDVRPLQQPHPLLFFGGASDGALTMGARLCDVYAIYAEPLALDARAHRRVSRAGRGLRPNAGFNVSLRPIIADTEGAAWDKANRILAQMTGKKGWSRQEDAAGPVDNAGKRLMSFRRPGHSRRASVDADRARRPARSATPHASSARPSRSPTPS